MLYDCIISQQFMCWFSSLMVCFKSYCKNKHDSFETKATVWSTEKPV